MIGIEQKPSRAEAIGALSRISDEVVRGALGLPRAGRVYDLGLELNSRIPHNPEFVRFAMSFTHTPEGTGALSPFQYSVESVFGALHVGTHIDSFIHIQKDGRVYGGHLASESRDDRGWKRHGIETVPPILGRAICLDIPGLKGLGRLPDRYEVTVDDLKQELARTGLEIRSGDIVIVRTGKIQDFGDEGRSKLPSRGWGGQPRCGFTNAGCPCLGPTPPGRSRCLSMIQPSPRTERCSSKRACT